MNNAINNKLNYATVVPSTNALSSLSIFARKVIDTYYIWQERKNQREALLSMDDRMLKDIGLTRSEIYREVDKPFWVQ